MNRRDLIKSLAGVAGVAATGAVVGASPAVTKMPRCSGKGVRFESFYLGCVNPDDVECCHLSPSGRSNIGAVTFLCIRRFDSGAIQIKTIPMPSLYPVERLFVPVGILGCGHNLYVVRDRTNDLMTRDETTRALWVPNPGGGLAATR